MKLKTALIFTNLLLNWANAYTTYIGPNTVQYKVIQDSIATPSNLRISAAYFQGMLGPRVEAVIQTYDLIPCLFFEERFKGTLFGVGSDSIFGPATWYETDTKIGFQKPRKGDRYVNFDVGWSKVRVPIPANRTWIPYVGLQTIYQVLKSNKINSADHESRFFRPGQNYAFSIGLHRDIAYPFSRFEPVGYSSSTKWNFSSSHELGIKYYTLEYYDSKKNNYENGFPALFWNYEGLFTPLTIGAGIELTYANKGYTPYLFHMKMGINFKN